MERAIYRKLVDWIASGDEGCIEWWGATTKDGYPVMNFRGWRTVSARRVAWVIVKNGLGSYPHFKGRLYATCGNKNCINPYHMELRR